MVSAGPGGFVLLSAFCSGAGLAVAVVSASTAGAVATCSGVVAASEPEVGFDIGGESATFSGGADFASPASAGCKSAIFACGTSTGFVSASAGEMASAGPEGFVLLSAFCSGAGLAGAVVRSSAAGAVATCCGVAAASEPEAGFDIGDESVIFSGGADFASPLSAGCKSAIFAGGTSTGFGAAFFAARIGGALFGLFSLVCVAR